MSKIEPALTPEEWANQPEPMLNRDGDWAYAPEGVAGVIVGTDAVGHGLVVGSRARHGLAALCLHDQPFGFTREDVEIVRWAADEAEWSARRGPGQTQEEAEAEARARYEDLADRIEALLPPEGS